MEEKHLFNTVVSLRCKHKHLNFSNLAMFPQEKNGVAKSEMLRI